MSHNGHEDICYLEFNQERNCLAVGTSTGYRIYNCDPFGKCYEKEQGGMNLVCMLFCTSLVALVGGGEHPSLSPRQLSIVNTKRETTITQMTFLSRILGVKLNRKRLMVLLQEKVHLYDITNMKELHTIDTPSNPKGNSRRLKVAAALHPQIYVGIGALSPSSENIYLACLSQQNTGDLLIFDALNLSPLTVIQAHKSPIAFVTFNDTGTLLATASDKGTVIRVFSVPDGVCRYQFRRGSFTATISFLSFNLTSQFLVVSSDSSETIHIFKLDNSNVTTRPGEPLLEDPDLVSTMPNKSSVTQFIPTALTEILEPQRHFAHLKIPETHKISGNSDVKIQHHHIATLNNQIPQVMVATTLGYFYLFAIDLVRGGEGTLVKQFSLNATSD